MPFQRRHPPTSPPSHPSRHSHARRPIHHLLDPGLDLQPPFGTRCSFSASSSSSSWKRSLLSPSPPTLNDRRSYYRCSNQRGVQRRSK
ncbi:hypothetical protein PIB30_050314 [Stylosanthes scabra]|uniref:Uncharacterized protein n=1 Tax=Stylosanthes scabra TaxID=79078 RepID=A0ABU6RHS0_9FABA|nr:hypothetical protein [Stylosanthes scabra]